MRGYHEDFVGWTEDTARAICEGRWQDIDRAALADEVESLGKRDRREVVNRIKILLLHLLKLRYQPERQTRSWFESIDTQRDLLRLILRDSPSLTAQLPELTREAYRLARRKAFYETHLALEIFPEENPFTGAEIWGDAAGLP